MKFPDAQAFGFQCGKRSRITLVDIDSPDERVVEDAIKIFGKSPALWRTGSGNFAMPFRWNGERRRIRPISDMPIDILGAGYAVAPPSLGRKGKYRISRGKPSEPPRSSQTSPSCKRNQPGDKIPVGKRADVLFRFALDQALAVDDLDTLIDVVRTRNLDCEQPLSEVEVIKTASSAWGYEVRGENLVGRGGAMVITHSVIDALIDYPDAWRLYGKLKRHNWRDEFVLANGLGREWRWGWGRFKAAREILVRLELIACKHEGGRGPHDPPIYTWITPKVSTPETNK